MIDEERNQSEETPEEAAGPEEESAPEESAPEEEVAPEQAEEPAAEEADAHEEAEAPEEGAAPDAAAAPEEPAEPTHPKQLRKRARSRHTGEPQPPRGPDERAADRAARRQRRAQTRRAWRSGQRQKRAERPDAAGTAPTPASEHGAGRPRVRQGVVVSDRADKTITVRIDVTRQHRTYEKIVRSSSMLHAHDEQNEAGVGDTVRVVESRPLSRTKRWRLVDVLERAR